MILTFYLLAIGMSSRVLRLSPSDSPSSLHCRTILSQNVRVNNTVHSPGSGRQRTRAQTAAYLLGVRKELPDVDNEAMKCMRAVQNFYKGPEMDDQPIEPSQRYNHDKADSELEKSKSNAY